jgi:hypothetical protein
MIFSYLRRSVDPRDCSCVNAMVAVILFPL